AVGAWERVRDPAQRQSLRRDDLADAVGRVLVQLAQRGGVEGARSYTTCAQRLEPGAKLARGLVRERDGEDLAWAERAACNLVGNPVRDRRRLARARAGEDAHRPADRIDGTPLLWVQLHARQRRPRGRTGP